MRIRAAVLAAVALTAAAAPLAHPQQSSVQFPRDGNEALALLSVRALAQSNPQIATQSFDSAEITKKVAPAVVLIKGTTDTGDVLGTGFIISSDGKIATNLSRADRTAADQRSGAEESYAGAEDHQDHGQHGRG